MKQTFSTLSACVLTLGLASNVHADSTARQSSDIDALREAIAKQQAALDAQQQQLDALQAAKLASQDAARASITYSRPTISAADGRSSISLVIPVVQIDAAHYSQDSAGPSASDFRRGSVGSTSNREINGARDPSDGIYFRRARVGAIGVINRDFNYRFVMELGGSGTEGPTRINDAWINYTGFAPFTLQFGAIRIACTVQPVTPIREGDDLSAFINSVSTRHFTSMSSAQRRA